MFSPHQVVCLEGKNKSLFCEVIDVITSRSLCWVRPVLLVMNYNPNLLNPKTSGDVYDLRFTADLLWKIDDFRNVLDVEYLEFFVQLEDFKFDEQQLQLAHQKLSYFVRDLSQNDRQLASDS